MNCERAVELLTGPADESAAAERRLAHEHLAACADCRGAVAAVHALRLASLAPVPAASQAARERALSPDPGRDRRPGAREPAGPGRFWLGMCAGAALAAGVALAAFRLFPAMPSGMISATPELELALNETHEVNISLATTEPLADAEIHVLLNGAVGLAGYAGQRELRWRTSLDAGVNRLTLPVVATGTEGGQVLVEVVHAGKDRKFLIDVHAHA